MLKTQSLIALVLAHCFVAVSWLSPIQGQELVDKNETQAIPFELSAHDKQIVNLRIQHILERDQQFRAYQSFETTDDTEIDRLQKLEGQAQLRAMSDNEGKLPKEISQLLFQFQHKNDLGNLEEFVAIVTQYGYPSPQRLGVESDGIFPLLLHPPVEPDQIESHLDAMSALLRPEVEAGRLEPKKFAMFYDNMLGKILRRPQLYGTNQVFNRETGEIEPPIVQSLESANQARREIGMPELQEGEYRLAPADGLPKGSGTEDSATNDSLHHP